LVEEVENLQNKLAVMDVDKSSLVSQLAELTKTILKNNSVEEASYTQKIQELVKENGVLRAELQL
jgi:hypothetical protein